MTSKLSEPKGDRSDLFIKILKVLESYEIEGERCVKYPTPLARDLTELMRSNQIFYTDTKPIIIPRVPPEDREIIGEGVTVEPVFPPDQVIHESKGEIPPRKPPPPPPPQKRSIIEGKKPPQKPTKAMTKYRILEIPQHAGGMKYEIQEQLICHIPKPGFFAKLLGRKTKYSSWDKIYFAMDAEFDTLDEAECNLNIVINHRKRQPKVVFETEV